MKYDYDVLIIGGGPAGLSAALSLGRMSVRALVVDDGRPRNAPSSHANNFPSRDGVHPAKWREDARADLKKYPTIELRADSVLKVESLIQPTVEKSSENSHNSPPTTAFSVELKSQSKIVVRNVVLAYGITDVMPRVDGFKELWGKLIYHCPFCHGYEVRNQKLAILAFSPMAFHPLPLIASLSKHTIFMTNGEMKLDSEQRKELEKYGLPLDDRKMKSVSQTNDGKLEIQFADGTTLDRDGAFAALKLPVTQKSKIGEQLGCEKTEFGFYKVNERGETSIPGVFAAGDCATMMHSVIAAAAAGSLVGAMLSGLTWKK